MFSETPHLYETESRFGEISRAPQMAFFEDFTGAFARIATERSMRNMTVTTLSPAFHAFGLDSRHRNSRLCNEAREGSRFDPSNF